jgi:hypothetical protein
VKKEIKPPHWGGKLFLKKSFGVGLWFNHINITRAGICSVVERSLKIIKLSKCQIACALHAVICECALISVHALFNVCICFQIGGGITRVFFGWALLYKYNNLLCTFVLDYQGHVVRKLRKKQQMGLTLVRNQTTLDVFDADFFQFWRINWRFCLL